LTLKARYILPLALWQIVLSDNSTTYEITYLETPPHQHFLRLSWGLVAHQPVPNHQPLALPNGDELTKVEKREKVATTKTRKNGCERRTLR
jgi:hypothetical protein